MTLSVHGCTDSFLLMIYCLGFMFDMGFQNVVLIRKKRPAWQEGLLNGVGGKVEIGELPLEAMVREFREETGIITTHRDWMYRFTFNGKFGEVHVFIAVEFDLASEGFKAQEDEPVIVKPIKEIFESKEVIPNLRWMIPLVMDITVKKVSISYD